MASTTIIADLAKVEKLDGNNYDIWHCKIQYLLNEHVVLETITHSMTMPEKVDTAQHKRKMQAIRIGRRIIEMAPNVKMVEHLRKMCIMIRDLKATCNNLSDEQQILALLRSLPDSWDQMKLTVMHTEMQGFYVHRKRLDKAHKNGDGESCKEKGVESTMIEEDHCAYTKRFGKSFTILTFYVDDFLLAGNDMWMIIATKEWLSSNFDMRNMGEIDYVFGLKILRDCSKKLLVEIVPHAADPEIIYCDSMTALGYVKNPKYHGKMKHIETRYHFILDTIAHGELLLEHVPTIRMVADPTKPLARDPFLHHVKSLVLRRV
ncbi:hypothetical protein RJ640_022262 [Escallonia rubra]|uniref:Reverse transcriptase Ty1/copia-type domain-containing protein n=1 Tax=Escallonia rubra TaxID=112253 RepID=A0AA88RQT9_9ASTE|nr:hypothetical protein RJ640_022262 [Escallonia rubra]